MILGSVLCPPLFFIYVNKLPKLLTVQSRCLPMIPRYRENSE